MSNIEKVAHKLIETLGVAGALRACRENMWAGVAAKVSALSDRIAET